jgi:hypothetical protein
LSRFYPATNADNRYNRCCAQWRGARRGYPRHENCQRRSRPGHTPPAPHLPRHGHCASASAPHCTQQLDAARRLLQTGRVALVLAIAVLSWADRWPELGALAEVINKKTDFQTLLFPPSNSPAALEYSPGEIGMTGGRQVIHAHSSVLPINAKAGGATCRNDTRSNVAHVPFRNPVDEAESGLATHEPAAPKLHATCTRQCGMACKERRAL